MLNSAIISQIEFRLVFWLWKYWMRYAKSFCCVCLIWYWEMISAGVQWTRATSPIPASFFFLFSAWRIVGQRCGGNTPTVQYKGILVSTSFRVTYKYDTCNLGCSIITINKRTFHSRGRRHTVKPRKSCILLPIFLFLSSIILYRY